MISTSANHAAQDLIASRRRGAVILAVYIVIMTGVAVWLAAVARR